MPVARFQMPDGRVARFSVPDGTTPEQAQQMIAQSLQDAKPAAQQKPSSNASPVNAIDSVAMGVTDPIHGGAQLLTHVLPDGVVQAGNKFNNWLADKTGLVAKITEGGVDEMVAKREADYQAGRKAANRNVTSLVTGKQEDPGFDWWRTAGNVISPANKAIPVPVAGASLGVKVLGGAGSGVASAALTPTTGDDYWKSKRDQATTGAAFGGLTPVIASGAARIVSPKASTNVNVQTLRNEGVTPTIGQALGGRWNALEEKAQSIPIVGDFISSARQRSLDQFNKAAINRASGKVGEAVDGVGQDAVATAGDKISKAYDTVKTQIGHFTIDPQGAHELGTLKTMAQTLPEKEKKVFDQMWELLSNEVSPNGSIVADSFKRIDSKLGLEAGRFGKSSDAYQQQLGDALSEMQRIINQNALRANPQAAALKQAADAGWANLVRVEGASKAAKNNGGVFTPAQLNSAIQQADRSVRGRAVARGTALMQDLGNAGQSVIGNKVPNSFTTDRMLLAGGSLGAGAVAPAVPLGLLGTGLLYTAPMQGLLSGAVSARPQGAKAVADALRKSSPTLGLLSSQVGLNLAR